MLAMDYIIVIFLAAHMSFILWYALSIFSQYKKTGKTIYNLLKKAYVTMA